MEKQARVKFQQESKGIVKVTTTRQGKSYSTNVVTIGKEGLLKLSAIKKELAK